MKGREWVIFGEPIPQARCIQRANCVLISSNAARLNFDNTPARLIDAQPEGRTRSRRTTRALERSSDEKKPLRFAKSSRHGAGEQIEVILLTRKDVSRAGVRMNSSSQLVALAFSTCHVRERRCLAKPRCGRGIDVNRGRSSASLGLAPVLARGTEFAIRRQSGDWQRGAQISHEPSVAGRRIAGLAARAGGPA